ALAAAEDRHLVALAVDLQAAHERAERACLDRVVTLADSDPVEVALALDGHPLDALLGPAAPCRARNQLHRASLRASRRAASFQRRREPPAGSRPSAACRCARTYCSIAAARIGRSDPAPR